MTKRAKTIIAAIAVSAVALSAAAASAVALSPLSVQELVISRDAVYQTLKGFGGFRRMVGAGTDRRNIQQKGRKGAVFRKLSES